MYTHRHKHVCEFIYTQIYIHNKPPSHNSFMYVSSMSPSFTCVTWLRHCRAALENNLVVGVWCHGWLMYSYVWHDSWIHMCDMAPSLQGRFSRQSNGQLASLLSHVFICVTWPLHSHVWHGSVIAGPLLKTILLSLTGVIFDSMYLYVWHDLFIHMCDMAPSRPTLWIM